MAHEREIINSADLKSLKAGLKDGDPFVRAIAARALGILGDKDSAGALAEFVGTIRVFGPAQSNR